MPYKFDPLRHHWRHYPTVYFPALVKAENETYRSHPMVGHEAKQGARAHGQVSYDRAWLGEDWVTTLETVLPPSD